jgi:hypothetical protein
LHRLDWILFFIFYAFFCGRCLWLDYIFLCGYLGYNSLLIFTSIISFIYLLSLNIFIVIQHQFLLLFGKFFTIKFLTSLLLNFSLTLELNNIGEVLLIHNIHPFEVLTAQLTCAVFNNFAKHVFYLLNTVPLRLKHLQPLLHIYFTPSSSLFSLIIIAIMIKVSLRWWIIFQWIFHYILHFSHTKLLDVLF